jgi:hypothetical protein
MGHAGKGEPVDMRLINLLSALRTPVIALITTYIAVQQYRTNKLKVRLDLFEKRYAIYQGVKDFIRSAVREGNVSDEAFCKLDDETQDAFFLFNERVEEYVDELRSNGARLHYLRDQLNDQTIEIGEERNRLSAESAELSIWFGRQYLQSKQVFKKGLSVSE